MIGGLTRRTLVAAAVAPAVGRAVMPGAAFAQDAPPPLTIGVLSDQSGLGASVSGPPLVQAVKMAIKDTGLLPDGRPLSLLEDSFTLKPDDALAVARRWCDHGVSAIIGVPGAAAALAVQALTTARGRTALMTATITPELTGNACSPLASSWTIDSASMAHAMVWAMAREGIRTWFLVVPDTVLGIAVEADVSRAIEAAGGQVAGRSRHASVGTDYGSIAAQARASGAGAIGLCDIAQALTDQLAPFQDGGLFADGRRVVAFVPSLGAIHAAGPAAAKGLMTTGMFYWDQNEAARSFANRFVAAMGQMPDAAHAAAYAAVRHYLRAVVASESIDAARVNQEMRRIPVYFFGRTAHLRLDGRLTADLSLLRVKPPESMRGAWDHYDQVGVIPAADVYRPLNQSGCGLRA